MKSWASISDLYERYGDEFVDKISLRRKWDNDLKTYIADESTESMVQVQQLALNDSKFFILSNLKSRYTDSHLVSGNLFPVIKYWHIQLAIAFLKRGGECEDCKKEFKEMLGDDICNDDKCLTKKSKTFMVARNARMKCEGYKC